MRILNSIEDQVFRGKTNQYAVFKQFDVDNDGYVSQQDIATALKQLKIQHDTDDVKQLMCFLDKNRKGYIEFNEFSEQIRPSAIANNSKALEIDDKISMNVSQPSVQYITDKFAAEATADSTKKAFISQLRPKSNLLQAM